LIIYTSEDACDALCVQIIFTIDPEVFRDFCKLNVNTMKALQRHSKSSLKSLRILCTIAFITISPEIYQGEVPLFFFGAMKTYGKHTDGALKPIEEDLDKS
jgi:hypothetical protein